MINICKPNGNLIKSFKNDDAFNHLSGGELLEDHPEIGATQWGFVVFPPKKVPNLYLNLKQKPVPTPLKGFHNGNRQTTQYFAFWPYKLRITEEGFSWFLGGYDKCRRRNLIS